MSWFACHRSEEMLSLLRQDPKAMNLLLLIACRARYTEDVCPVTKLGYGQAFIGDFKEAGISSRQAYRLALKRLFKSGFLTIQGTNKGTIVTLLPQAIFSISVPPKEPTKEPSRNHQGTIEEPLRTREQGNKGTNEDGEEEKIIILPPKFQEVETFAKSQPMAIPQECTEAFFDEMEALQWTYKGIGCVAKTAWQARFRRYATNWINNANSPNRNFR